MEDRLQRKQLGFLSPQQCKKHTERHKTDYREVRKEKCSHFYSHDTRELCIHKQITLYHVTKVTAEEMCNNFAEREAESAVTATGELSVLCRLKRRWYAAAFHKDPPPNTPVFGGKKHSPMPGSHISKGQKRLKK